jgi:DNA primase
VSTQLSNEFKETVRTRTDLAALIGESVSLSSRGGGRELVGLCPFHPDHDPSLRVYPDRQTYRCWACQNGGDCFTWVMEYDKVEFREALEILARRAGVPIPASSGRPQPSAPDQKPTLLEALVWAQNVFHQTLLQSPGAEKARRYLTEQRRFTPETIRKYHLGYHPGGWDWLQQQARGKYSTQTLLAARLVTENRNGSGYSDFFRGRVLFPICNERGQPVSFGGRVLPGEDDSFGKYQNGYESPVYHKSRVVFGLNFAREALKASNALIVTEGYTDCITLHQQGIGNAVATCGTALTDQQVATIKRFARRVVLVYDGDDAGVRAADKAVERFLAQDIDLRILTLPNGEDPAEFLEHHSADAFRELAAAAPEAWEYKFRFARRRHGLESVDGKQRVLEEMLALLASAPNMAENIREGILLGQLASRLGISETLVRQRYGELRGKAPRRVRTDDRQPAAPSPALARLFAGRLSRDDRLECEVLEILSADPALVKYLQADVTPEMIRNERLRALLRVYYAVTDETNVPSLDRVLSAVEEGELKRLAVWIDDQAREKDLRSRLRETTAGSPDGCPLFLRQSIAQLKWRREEQSHGRAVVELSAQGDGAHRMDEAAEALLRHSTEFHQRRATKRAPVEWRSER